MRIIITSNTLDYGGAERQRVTLANELAERGHSVQIRVIQKLGPLQNDISDLVEVYRVKSVLDCGHLRTSDPILITGTTKTETAHALLLKSRSVGKISWVVATHNPVTTLQATYPWLVRILIRFCDRLVCLSKQQATTLIQTDGLDEKKISIIGNGIDIQRFFQDQTLTRDEDKTKTISISFVGRLVEQKGLDVLLDALVQLQEFDWTATIAGSGPMDLLANAPQYAEIRHRLNWLGDADTVGVLAGADVLIIPSRNEAYPLVLLEALVYGCPVVATTVGAVSEIVTDGCTQLVPPGNPTVLAKSIKSFIEEAGFYKANAIEHAPQYAVRLSSTSMVDSYESLALDLRPPPKLDAYQVGPTLEVAGGISSVIRDSLEFGVGSNFVFGNISSYSGRGKARDMRLLWSAAIVILIKKFAKRKSIFHFHLSQGGSFIREGLLVFLCGTILKMPCIITIHGSRFGQFVRAHPRIVKNVLQASDAVIVLTNDAESAVGDLRIGKRIIKLANSVDVPETMRPFAMRELSVLFAGEVGERKGVDVLLQAWPIVSQALPSARMLLAGPVTVQWQQFDSTLLDSVTYLGVLKQDEVRRLLSRCALAVLPSRAEAMPKFVLEAMAAGTPVVTTDVGALPEIVDDTYGSIVSVGDVNGLADKILRILSNNELAAEMGRAAHGAATSRFSHTVHRKTLLDLYSSLAADNEMKIISTISDETAGS